MGHIINYLWPYDEVQIQNTVDGARFIAPWVKVTFPSKIDAKTFERFESLRRDGPKTAEDLQLVNAVLQPVSKYPLYYCLPNHTKKIDPQIPAVATAEVINLDWDASSLFSFCQAQPEAYDAISVLSCFRHFHLQDMMVHLQQTPKDLRLFNLEGKALREATLLYLRQNHYVTEKCQEVLTPAKSLHPVAGEKISEFIREEQGHDKLLALSFKELACKAEDIEVLPSLKAVMENFKSVASKNLIAFCFIIDMFERSPEASKNPIVMALLKLGETKAAKPIQAHANINVDGGHDNESLEILNALGLVPKSYVQEAIVLAQKSSDLMIAFLKERNTYLEKFKNA